MSPLIAAPAPSVEAIEQTAKWHLFVEGSSDLAFDPHVLGAILDPRIQVKHLFSSRSLRAAAKSFTASNPYWLFVIDRDFMGDDVVEGTWRDFPAGRWPNLLIWRRRELENYFIDPEFLVQSDYCVVKVEQLVERLVKECSKRIFYVALEAALQYCGDLIHGCAFPPNEAKVESITDAGVAHAFINGCDIPAAGHFDGGTEDIRKVMHDVYDRSLHEYTGGGGSLAYGTGRWQEFVGGKQILNSMINERFFHLENLQTKARLVGQELVRGVARTLVTQDGINRPGDFDGFVERISQLTSGG